MSRLLSTLLLEPVTEPADAVVVVFALLVCEAAGRDSTEFNKLTQICLVPPHYIFVFGSGLREM